MDNQEIKPEGSEYWENRRVDDSRKDWRDSSGNNWIAEYWSSQNHPHRKLIIGALEKVYPFNNLLEIGCNAGPNLAAIEQRWPFVKLYGIDLNNEAINYAADRLPGANLFKFNVLNMPFFSRQFDCTLADASLMYVPPEDIKKAMDKINEVTDKSIVICDWDSDSKEGIIKDGHWARDYGQWLKDFGFKVEKIKLTNKDWPAVNWIKNGNLWIAQR